MYKRQTLGAALADALPHNLVAVQATVPVGATYGAARVLRLLDVAVNAGDLAARADDGLQVVAYPGDATGNQALARDDVTLIQRVAARTDPGFAAYPLIDSAAVGDVNRDGRITVSDALLVLRATQGFSIPSVPAIPVIARTAEPVAAAAPAAVAPAARSVVPAARSVAPASAAIAAAEPVLRLDGGALDFGLQRPLASASTWVSDWVSGSAPAPSNAWKVTI